MDLPPPFLCLGRWWRSEFRADLMDRENATAITDRHRGVIEFDPKCSAPLRIFMHELLHCAEDGLDDDVGHATLDRLAAGITDALVANPALLDWIYERAKERP